MSRKNPVRREEQIRLVYECRNSGLSDSQWCRQHGIAPSTFSNWVCRNKIRGDVIIPEPLGVEEYWPEAKPDIVQVNLVKDGNQQPALTKPVQNHPSTQKVGEKAVDFMQSVPVLEVEIGDTRIRVSNEVDPGLLAHALQILRGGAASC